MSGMIAFVTGEAQGNRAHAQVPQCRVLSLLIHRYESKALNTVDPAAPRQRGEWHGTLRGGARLGSWRDERRSCPTAIPHACSMRGGSAPSDRTRAFSRLVLGHLRL